MHDVAITGGGIVGLATARALAIRGMKVVVLEREDRLGAHQTTHNSGVIHAGIYYAPGSLKARLCVEGAAALYAYCEEKGIAAERCGKLVVALREADLDRLDELERRARANGVDGLARLGPDEIAAIEPAARGLSALHSPNTGMVDFGAVAAAYADDVRAHGGEIRTGAAVRALVERDDGVELVGTGVRARHAVACAGAWSDRLALASGARPDLRIVPFRGSYLRLLRPELVRGQIYPVPDPALPFLGVHLSRTIAGDVLIGPTALLAPAHVDLRATLRWPGTARVMRRWWRTGFASSRTPPAGACWCARRPASCPPSGPATCGAARRASAPRRSAATARWWTTSSSPAPGAPCTSSTRRRRPPRPRSRSRS